MSPLDMSKQELDGRIRNLTRHTLVMEEPDLDPGADICFNPEDHRELRNHLIAVVLAEGCEAERNRWNCDGSSLTPVQKRLILANLKRRNRFLYAQRHAQSLRCDPPILDYESQ